MYTHLDAIFVTPCTGTLAEEPAPLQATRLRPRGTPRMQTISSPISSSSDNSDDAHLVHPIPPPPRPRRTPKMQCSGSSSIKPASSSSSSSSSRSPPSRRAASAGGGGGAGECTHREAIFVTPCTGKRSAPASGTFIADSIAAAKDIMLTRFRSAHNGGHPVTLNSRIKWVYTTVTIITLL